MNLLAIKAKNWLGLEADAVHGVPVEPTGEAAA